MTETAKEKSSTLQRVLRILEIICTSPRPLTPTQINNHLDLPKPTIHRLCQQLEQEGFIQPQMDGRGLLPGPALQKMALGILGNNDLLRSQRHAILQRLSSALGETCNISIPDNSGEMVYFDRVETHWPLRIQLQVNDRVPMHCTASGKLFLSELASQQRSRLLKRLPLERFTDNTLTTAEQLKPVLKEIRERGVGVDNEEFMRGMVAVSVPIRDAEGRLYAALAMHAPTARLSLEQALEHIPDMQQAAEELAALMEVDD